ncbi:ceramidase domain-containing protein [Halovulum sp. GXIMD14794]
MPILIFVPWAFTALLMGAFFAVGALGWPGEFVGAGAMFCEAFRDSWIRQPANTWSNLGFVAAGLWMVSHAAQAGRRASAPGNIFSNSRSLPILYAALVISIGPGSMALHGTGHAWGHSADVVAMFTFIMFPIAWAVTHLAGGSERAFWTVYLALTGPVTLAHLLEVLPFSGIVLYAILIPTAVALELVRYFRKPTGTRSLILTLGALGCFLLGFVAWRLSLTGAPLCAPGSLLQGHALWHLLCAAATVCLYLAYMNERTGAAADTRRAARSAPDARPAIACRAPRP